jgi:hypothetical protein
VRAKNMFGISTATKEWVNGAMINRRCSLVRVRDAGRVHAGAHDRAAETTLLCHCARRGHRRGVHLGFFYGGALL